MTYTIKTVRHEDWPKAKEIRLAALRDPVARLAFLETLEQAVARPDDFWQGRAQASAEGTSLRQFVAERADGEWLGTVTARVELPGDDTAFGQTAEVPQTHVIGVYVQSAARGTGLAERLVGAAVQWSWSLPSIERVRLHVHEDNARAEALYRKVGFERSGNTVLVPGDVPFHEIELAIARS
ncbi:GNAT family N-acetyltransferase [Kitasatospora kifunensis]|uniref:RimJ/RimL family protein N-acetyltransferase n=1 Tax=Kitasatospora kifunensis TaxID=58351 RepID=A0A7W7RAP0_KITKI|nr:GNAT family N-acetyltransferase [Kitasatospora kifunensis]MBB4927851.1 RimJ/RimL family protein N-acetyltransferase [Kitasatospora kifunensis]